MGHKCYFCGGELIWDSDANAGDFLSEFDDDDDAVVQFYHCSKCGRSYEIVDPVKSERETTYLDYWKDNV